ncbi:MAG: nucleotidyltransferase domain-containing protein [Nitrospira sp.]|jgi:predicted nucleotidyltransferase|nr:nucleotidyltransferase domain-containing protein [Nitrospira sp. BO4]
MDSNTTTSTPTRDELNAELVEIPEPPEQPESPSPPGFEDNVEIALRHVKGRRGGDLVGVILVGSGARRALTPHSDIDLIALVKGEADSHEILRVGERLADIRYRGYQSIEDDLAYSLRLPSLLRKGRILYDYEGVCAQLIEKVHQRFRQGPPPASINEQIRLKAECFHLLGKAQDLLEKPGTAHYLLTLFYEDCISAFFRLRGFWLVAPVDVHRFMFSREPALEHLAGQFLTATTLADRLNFGRQFADLLFKDVPNPARID